MKIGKLNQHTYGENLKREVETEAQLIVGEEEERVRPKKIWKLRR